MSAKEVIINLQNENEILRGSIFRINEENKRKSTVTAKNLKENYDFLIQKKKEFVKTIDEEIYTASLKIAEYRDKLESEQEILK